MSFYDRNVHGSRGPRRSEVLQALVRATQAGTEAPNMTVQAGDSSACANALALGRPVVVDDMVCAVVPHR